ncbi:MAG: DUF3105 domain-containing protein [Nocardioides sp.]
MTSSPHRRRFLILGIAIALVIGLAVVLLLRGGDDDASASGLGDVVTYTDLDRDHVAGDVDYPQSPPVGGEHDPIWLNCGVYDRPVREENAVHSLEHGAVWITYQPGLSAEEIDNLAAKLPEKGILSPFEDQDAPVVVTVWGAQLALDGPDDPRLDLFIEQYGDGHTAPEPQAACVGGVEEFEDSGGNA